MRVCFLPGPPSLIRDNTSKSGSTLRGPCPSRPGLCGSWGTYGEQAGYAAILLSEKLRGGRSVVDHYHDEALNVAIDELIAQMARVEPGLIGDEAREVIAGTVENLLRPEAVSLHRRRLIGA